jgi:predicted Fe-S protein YdhL (DUF1289 family)
MAEARFVAECPPASPCIGICLLDPSSGFCRGCLRNVAEIATWHEANAAQKHAILARIAGRRRAGAGCATESGE